MRDRTDRLAPYALLALFCLFSLAFRPLIPADETRYLTVAWEMFTQRDFFVPTLNFAPYHHKPPLLFWLIDVSWAVFGVARWSAALVIFAVSALCLALTAQVGRRLFPDRRDIAERIPWLTLGSVAFVIYSSLILFDLLLTACILSAFLAMHAFARHGRLRDAILAGLLFGLGILAKGPVMLIHIVWPVLLYPLWRSADQMISVGAFLRGIGIALIATLLPVAIWLVPALLQTDGTFAYALIWEQSAGRISGNMEASHPRPFFFYLALLPVLFLPWILSPRFWRALPALRLGHLRDERPQEFRTVRLLLFWALGIIATFSVISGKQPHYVVPVIPLVTIMLAYLMATVPLPAIRRGAAIVILLFTLFQAAASLVLLPRYDLSPIAALMAARPEADTAFVGFYQGEFNFLARRKHALGVIPREGVNAWFDAHPGGYLVHFHDGPDDLLGRSVLTIPYRDGFASVIEQPAGGIQDSRGIGSMRP